MATWDINLNALKEELAYLFPREDDYYVFAQEVGLDPGTIIFTHKAINDWHAILEEAHKVGKVVRIIEKAYKRYPDRVDLQVAECYMHKQIEQPVNNYHSLTLSVHVNTSDPTITVFECFTQVQRTAQFLSCWQDVIAQVNKNTPGSPLLFEQCDSIKPSLQDLKSAITNAKQLLTDEHTILPLDTNRRSLVNKLDIINEKLDDLIRHIQYLLACDNKKTRYAMELRQIIQNKIAEVMQNLEGVNGLTIACQKHSKQEKFLLYGDPSRLNQTPTPLKIVPTVAPSQPESAQAPSSNNLSRLKKRDLRQAICEFFSEYELDIICTDLAEDWKDNSIRYKSLPGDIKELKVNFLVNDYCDAKGKFFMLKDWLIQRDKDFGSKLQEIVDKQK